jgi:hypothetical protein
VIDPEVVRSFILNNAVIASKLESLSKIGKISEEELFNDGLIKPFIPQIKLEIRENADVMSAYYKIFYMLENHIRIIIESLLKEEFGTDWWNKAVPEPVKINANSNKKRELEAGFSLRSVEMLPYTNFGELGDIVREHWTVFGQIFRDKGHFNRVMFNLNLLRATIAHCGLLSEDEVLRLKLTVRDWFRLME